MTRGRDATNLELVKNKSEESKELDQLARLEVSDDSLDEHSDVLEDSSAGGGDDPSESESSLRGEKREGTKVSNGARSKTIRKT